MNKSPPVKVTLLVYFHRVVDRGEGVHVDRRALSPTEVHTREAIDEGIGADGVSPPATQTRK
jgi:hypothetical protein